MSDNANGLSPDFFSNPVLNSPYVEPTRHWELVDNAPTGKIVEARRKSDYVTPIARTRRTQANATQNEFDFGDEGGAHVNAEDKQRYQYDRINEIREAVAAWRSLPESSWGVTPETARLLRHWRTHDFKYRRPFFCQIEAVEVYIWLTEVAPNYKRGKEILAYLAKASDDANAGIQRIALKLATGAGKTTVMAMLIAWQTINAVLSPSSKKFTNCFLVIAPGLTIKDRLQELKPNDLNAIYTKYELIPIEFSNDIKKARVVITNYHAFRLREELELKGKGRNFLQGRHGEKLNTTETPGKMLARVMPELLGMKHILVINDEAHHCYEEKPDMDGGGEFAEGEKDEIKERSEAARLWLNGIRAVLSKLKCRVVDLSATPFFLRGSGYAEGSIFPWTVSDFSLMDAIECGIVKLPRVPVSDNSGDDHSPVYRRLWDNVRNDMPKKARQNSKDFLDPAELPPTLITAIDELYAHYAKTCEVWESAEMVTPPCFIFVCQNTAVSKLVYDFVSGYEKPDGTFQPAHCPLFSNYDDYGHLRAKPNTILVDSVQLESGEGLSDQFSKVAAKELEVYKRELVERSGDAKAAENLKPQDILREVMNTVGKPGKLGAHVRCVVSVSMLTEGWDANNVTHILGLRAFGTQLICEQVVGRALRRSSYLLNDQKMLAPEYADIFGIPFDFASRGVIAKPTKPPKLTHVYAMSPARDDVEIVIPNVVGYRIDLPEETLSATWTEASDYTLSPDVVGPCETRMEGIVGESHEVNVKHLKEVRENTIIYTLTKYMLEEHFRKQYEDTPIHLFGKVKHIVADWVRNHLHCTGGAYPAQILYIPLALDACRRIAGAITKSSADNDANPVRAFLSPYSKEISTRDVDFVTSKTRLWKSSEMSHVNYAVCDSDWELEFCRVLDQNGRVKAWVKNDHLGFTVPYFIGTVRHEYIPDFVVVLDNGMKLVIEVKGFVNENVNNKRTAMESQWIPGVNRLGSYGRWAFGQFQEVFSMEQDFENFIDKFFEEEGK
ncbi:MAG: DEAD/DEAH box helicase family protein [Kiritimatiellae bacterium]|nr:DEAD/DEAH box helicase family protein [Kiritimatiellia bacterium]